MKRFALFIGLTTFVFFLNAYGDIHKAIFVFKNGSTTYEDSNTWSISWVDFNNDGYDDLFLPTNNSNQFNYLYQNNKGVFDTVQKTFLTDIPLQVVSANWGDVNNDGLKDVLIGQNINGQNDLFIQNCDGTFSKNEINRASKNNKFTHSTNWVDYNLDGNLVRNTVALEKILCYKIMVI